VVRSAKRIVVDPGSAVDPVHYRVAEQPDRSGRNRQQQLD
jgi:hypothetical protein